MKPKIKVEDLADKLYVSKVTVVNDLKLIKSILSKYNLTSSCFAISLVVISLLATKLSSIFVSSLFNLKKAIVDAAKNSKQNTNIKYFL